MKKTCFWLVYDEAGAEKNKEYINFYKKEAEGLGLIMRLVIADRLSFGVRADSLFVEYEEEAKPDFAIVRTIYPFLSRQLEAMNIPVFNSSTVSEICNDKAKTYSFITALNIKTIDTVFCKNCFLQKRLEGLTEKKVIKAVDGHGGSQVMLFTPGETKVRQVLSTMNNSDVVIQPLVGKRHQDLRVYVIGTKVIAAVLRTAEAGFKANFSPGGSVELYPLKATEKSIVEKIISAFDFGMVGIDFIIGDEGELIFNEIEDVVGTRMLYKCSDINLVRLYLSFICDRLKLRK